MRIQYRSAVPADAAQLLEYLRAVGSESDNLSFGPEGLPFSVEQEQALLARMETSSHSRFFLALDGTRIVGNACVDGSGNPRFAHRRNLAVSVLREYWDQGIGSGLMERMIAFARESGAELLSLEVRSDNARAIALYRKFGFRCFGTFPKFFKIGGQYRDVDCMVLELFS